MKYLGRNALLLSLLGVLSLHGPVTASAEDTDDALLTTPASPAVLAKGLEADGYQLGPFRYPTGKSVGRLSSPLRKNILASVLMQITFLSAAVPSHSEGRFAIVTNGGEWALSRIGGFGTRRK